MFPLRARVWGYSDILPRYTYATGGGFSPGSPRDRYRSYLRQRALARLATSTTLGYVTHATPSNTHAKSKSRLPAPV